MGATTATLAVIGALAGAGSAYMQGRAERDALKQQYKIEEYNAQMDKAEQELDLARQDKLLQKQLAESMANTNNFFGGQLEGDAFNFLGGQFAQGQEETRDLKAQEQYVQNKYITTEAIRRNAFNKNMKNNSLSTAMNMLSSGISGGMTGYSLGKELFKTPVKRDVTGTAFMGSNIRSTNASYRG